MRKSRAKDIYSRINKTESGCWEWTGATSRNGYGNVSVRGKTLKPHRISYIRSKGEIPEGMMVCHKCDNRKCINPEHLFLGTAKDNNKDTRDKGRYRPRRTPNKVKRTHCKAGHPFTKESTYRFKNGGRACLICMKIQRRNLYLKKTKIQ